MFRKTWLLVALLLGLLTSASIYSSTSRISWRNDESFPCPHVTSTGICAESCSGVGNTIRKFKIVHGGYPFVSEKILEQTDVQECSNVSDEKTSSAFFSFSGAWQFYANWVVWSLVWAVLLFGAIKIYAHNRD